MAGDDFGGFENLPGGSPILRTFSGNLKLQASNRTAVIQRVLRQCD
jgi:hypothetical protein